MSNTINNVERKIENTFSSGQPGTTGREPFEDSSTSIGGNTGTGQYGSGTNTHGLGNTSSLGQGQTGGAYGSSGQSGLGQTTSSNYGGDNLGNTSSLGQGQTGGAYWSSGQSGLGQTTSSGYGGDNVTGIDSQHNQGVGAGSTGLHSGSGVGPNTTSGSGLGHTSSTGQAGSTTSGSHHGTGTGLGAGAAAGGAAYEAEKHLGKGGHNSSSTGASHGNTLPEQQQFRNESSNPSGTGLTGSQGVSGLDSRQQGSLNQGTTGTNYGSDSTNKHHGAGLASGAAASGAAYEAQKHGKRNTSDTAAGTRDVSGTSGAHGYNAQSSNVAGHGLTGDNKTHSSTHGSHTHGSGNHSSAGNVAREAEREGSHAHHSGAGKNAAAGTAAGAASGAAVGHHASNTHDRSTTSSDPTSTQAPEQSHEGGGSNGLGTHAADCSGGPHDSTHHKVLPGNQPGSGHTGQGVSGGTRTAGEGASTDKVGKQGQNAAAYERSTTEGPVTGGAAGTDRFDTDKSSSSHGGVKGAAAGAAAGAAGGAATGQVLFHINRDCKTHNYDGTTGSHSGLSGSEDPNKQQSGGAKGIFTTSDKDFTNNERLGKGAYEDSNAAVQNNTSGPGGNPALTGREGNSRTNPVSGETGLSHTSSSHTSGHHGTATGAGVGGVTGGAAYEANKHSGNHGTSTGSSVPGQYPSSTTASSTGGVHDSAGHRAGVVGGDGTTATNASSGYGQGAQTGQYTGTQSTGTTTPSTGATGTSGHSTTAQNVEAAEEDSTQKKGLIEKVKEAIL
ncbi:hypothetical protein I350_03596 [Cryptococcus amylolentus CBS 6273]|uniref:Uncharacterized protein n=1 Tax=Cryptococcus amylolentus CBS 6273 TaxID=1296118 RepID=A0A1E3K593_9TREE|nr:hypothetical protein I350_03596 [Cryptococcus amylolentus CBS 6273]